MKAPLADSWCASHLCIKINEACTTQGQRICFFHNLGMPQYENILTALKISMFL